MAFLRNISMSKKLAGSAGLLLAFITLIGVLAISNLRSVDKLGTAMYEHQAVPLSHLGTLADRLTDMQRLSLRGVAWAGDGQQQSKVDQQIAADDAVITEHLSGYASTIDDPPEQATLQRIRGAYADYQRARNEVRVPARHGDAAAARAANERALASYTAVHSAVTNLSQANEREAHELAEQIASTYASGRALSLVILFAALALGAALSFLTARQIKRDVSLVLDRLRALQRNGARMLHEGLDAFAAGDLTHKYEPKTQPILNPGGDEIGQIAQAVNDTREALVGALSAYNTSADKLRGLIGEVSTAAGTVGAASEQMASTSQEAGKATGEIASAVSEVAQGAERQLRIVESAREAAEEVTRGAQGSATQAQQTVEVAQHTRGVAQEGVGAAQRASEAMRAVRESSEEVTIAIRELAGKSGQIGAIVETITGIAGQTNLLALNAAIEAARAGEQGRGFAVVADEVRKLAEEAQQAAEEIAGLIRGIQAETGKVVEVVETGAHNSENGASTVEQTREAFLRIDEGVREMTSRIEQIATVAEQGAVGASRLQEEMAEVAGVAEESSAATEQVSASTQQTSASTQEIAASAQELAGNAEQLNKLVRQFTVTA